MKKIFITPAILLLCGLFISTAVNAQESYKLAYKFQKGKTYRYSTITAGNTTQEMMGKEMKMSNGANMTVRLVVDDVLKNGNMVFIISADSAVISSKSQMMDTTMNMTDLIGKRNKFVVSPLGTIISREILDSIKTKGQFNGSFQRNLSNFSKLPENEIKMGDTWKSTTIDTIDMMGGKVAHTAILDLKLIGKEKKQGHDCLKIEYSGVTADTGKLMMNGMELYLEGSGKVKGITYFDVQQGLNVVDESTVDSEQTMAITGQQNMTIPMSQSMKTTRVLLEK
jgi:hypothetical protein